MARVAGIDLTHVHSVPSIIEGEADPTVDDDASKGFNLGDEFYNMTTGSMFKCTNSTPGAAVWSQLVVGTLRQADTGAEPITRPT